jgi:uncharacterized protein DUF4258
LNKPALPLVYRIHAVQRMAERDISEEDVAMVARTGKEIESYPDDKPYPSRLSLGWAHDHPIHVVTATTEHEIIVITVYEPDPDLWEPGFERRKP